MQRIVQRISKFFTGIFAGGSAVTMAAVFIIVCINSIRRYTIGKSFEWGEELPVFLAVYGIMFGAAYAYMQDRHIKFTMLVGFLPENTTRFLYMLVDLVMTGIGVLLTYSGYLFMLKRGKMESSGLINLAKDLKATTGIDQLLVFGHLYPYQAAMVVGGVLLTIAAVLRFLLRLGETRLSASVEG